MEKQSIKNTSSSSSSSMSYSLSQSSSWIRGTCIGRGCFGAVHTAINKSNGEVFAVKSVDLATCLPTQSESLENEISVLASLKPHPNIVRFLGDGISKEGTSSFRNLYLEYLPEGHAAGGINDEALLRRYAACLVSALRHVHEQGFVHCDVKARNVLVSQSSEIKLADFGSAIRLSKPTTTAEITPRGSPFWMAPEVIRREYQGPESDVWSLGCTIIEMFTGKPAWDQLGIIDSLSRIGYSDEVPAIPSTMSELCREFLDKCLKRDPNQRWSCDQLLKHPFLSQCQYSSLTESSPRCVLDWVNSGFDFEEEEVERSEWRSGIKIAAMARICKLATTVRAIWESESWVEVRSHCSKEEGAIVEYSESIRAELEYNIISVLNNNVVVDATKINDFMYLNRLSRDRESECWAKLRSQVMEYPKSIKGDLEYNIISILNNDVIADGFVYPNKQSENWEPVAALLNKLVILLVLFMCSPILCLSFVVVINIIVAILERDLKCCLLSSASTFCLHI